MSEPVDPVEARREAADILDGPEFGEPGSSWVDRALDWVGDRIADLLSGLASGDLGAVFALLVVGGAVVALLALLRRGGGPLAAQAPVIARERITSRGSQVARWRAAADAARAAGDWAEVVRCEHRHLAAVLDDAAMLVERDDRTALELLGDVAGRTQIEGGLRDVTSTFQGIWYGEEAPDQQVADAVRSVADEVVSSLGRPARSGSSR